MDRTRAFLSRLRRSLSGQAGFALIAALGASLVFGISGTTAMIYTTGNFRSASYSKADQRAFSLAEAGLNYAYSTLHNAPDPTMPGAVPLRSEQVEGGTVTWSGTLDTSTNVWTLTGSGRVPNPTGGANVARTVRGRARVGGGTRGGANNAVWNYVYAEAPTNCTTIGNAVTVNVPLYVRGDLCLQNSAQISGADTILRVGGRLTVSNLATVGSVLAPIREAHVAGGCILNAAPLHLPCGPVDRVFAGIVDSQNANLEKPAVDLDYWYANAKPGPMQNCTSGSFPGGFDNDTTMNRSLTADIDLTPAVAYDCQVRDGQGNLIGRIAWTPGSPGTLSIVGTVFFDGNIVFRNLVNAVYVGRATIYASGKITIRNSTTLCGIAGCGSGWQPTQNLLAFVAGTSSNPTGFTIQNGSTFQGAIYVVNDYSEENGSTVWGPVVARQIFLQNSTSNHYVPLGTLLPGMPQTTEEAIVVSNEPGSWS